MKPTIKSVTMYKTNWCGDCYRADAFFKQNEIEVKRIDIEEDAEAARKVEELNGGNRSVPTIVIEMKDGTKEVLVEPSYHELEDTLLDKGDSLSASGGLPLAF